MSLYCSIIVITQWYQAMKSKRFLKTPTKTSLLGRGGGGSHSPYVSQGKCFNQSTTVTIILKDYDDDMVMVLPENY